MSNEASTPPSLAPRKRRPPPLNPDNAENERLLRIYNGKRSRADDTATSTPSPNPPPPIPSASNPIPKEKPPPKSQPKPSTSHSRPTVETIEDEDNIRMAQRTKPKNPKTLVIHSDEEDSEIEEVEKPSLPKKTSVNTNKKKGDKTNTGNDTDSASAEERTETAEEELERLKRDWNATTYAFFEPSPEIAYHDGRRVHIFKNEHLLVLVCVEACWLRY